MATLSSAYDSDPVVTTELLVEEMAEKGITSHLLAHPNLPLLN